MDRKALLVLEDGQIFEGTGIGIEGLAVGELIFNTAHVGYQEALTDPSYAAQLMVFTTPHIGNIGCNSDDEESQSFWPAGIILREKPTNPSYWRSKISFQDYLVKHRVTGIAEIDTRALTRILRTRGYVSACIISNKFDVLQAQELAKSFQDVRNPNLLDKVTTSNQYHRARIQNVNYHIVVYDFGVKRNILRMLEKYEAKVTVVPTQTSVHQVLTLQQDGVVLSNGPGDPLLYVQAIDIARTLTLSNIPILGICLGHQLLGLALGARIKKLKFGHHGINHPIKDLNTNRVFISSQNHNFVLSEVSLPDEIRITHRSLFDDSIQGIQHRFKPFYGIQGHPEGCPGPIELEFIFESFILAVSQYSEKRKSGINECLNLPI
jgi:carbamoyl-phosphate synthase small subunit